MRRTILLCALLSLNAYALGQKNIGIFKQISPYATIDTEARALTEAQNRARGVQDYYRYFGMNIQARGYAMRSDCDAHPLNFCKDGIRTVHTGDFKPNYWQILGGFSSSWCGQAIVSGYYSTVYVNYVCGPSVSYHELGHNFRLRHAGLRNGENESEYGDGTAIMGGAYLNGIISPNMVRLGLDTNLNVISRTQQILIAPAELSIYSLHENEYTHSLISKLGTLQYFLSLRKVRGHPYAETPNTESLLYIHELASDGKTKRLQPDLRPGDSKILPNGVTVEYLEYSDETARANVLFNEPIPESVPMPVGFPTSEYAISAENNGGWYGPDYNGQGFDIQIKGSRAAIYWYTYNEDDDSTRFYYGVCLLTECAEGFDLWTTHKGTFKDPTLFENQFAGSARFNGNGIFNYNTVEHGRGSIELTPIALGDHPLSGHWYQPDRNGEGFSIQVFDGLMVAFWSTYGPRPLTAYSTTSAIQTQRWYMCVGESYGPEYNLTIYEASGGKWMQFDDVTLNIVGTARLTVINPDRMDFEYDIDAEGVKGSGGRELERLF